MASISLHQVTKTYGSGKQALQVLHGVSADIKDREFIVIVGPSGCGKSTLLRMVAGLEEISDGNISIGGRVVNDLEPSERDIAMVFQSYALYPTLSVADNIRIILEEYYPKAEVPERLDKLLGELGTRPVAVGVDGHELNNGAGLLAKAAAALVVVIVLDGGGGDCHDTHS